MEQNVDHVGPQMKKSLTWGLFTLHSQTEALDDHLPPQYWAHREKNSALVDCCQVPRSSLDTSPALPHYIQTVVSHHWLHAFHSCPVCYLHQHAGWIQSGHHVPWLFILSTSQSPPTHLLTQWSTVGLRLLQSFWCPGAMAKLSIQHSGLILGFVIKSHLSPLRETWAPGPLNTHILTLLEVLIWSHFTDKETET